MEAIDRAGTDEVKFDNKSTTCNIVLHFGRLGLWEVPLPNILSPLLYDRQISQVVELLQNFTLSISPSFVSGLQNCARHFRIEAFLFGALQ